MKQQLPGPAIPAHLGARAGAGWASCGSGKNCGLFFGERGGSGAATRATSPGRNLQGNWPSVWWDPVAAHPWGLLPPQRSGARAGSGAAAAVGAAVSRRHARST